MAVLATEMPVITAQSESIMKSELALSNLPGHQTGGSIHQMIQTLEAKSAPGA